MPLSPEVRVPKREANNLPRYTAFPIHHSLSTYLTPYNLKWVVKVTD